MDISEMRSWLDASKTMAQQQAIRTMRNVMEDILFYIETLEERIHNEK